MRAMSKQIKGINVQPACEVSIYANNPYVKNSNTKVHPSEETREKENDIGGKAHKK